MKRLPLCLFIFLCLITTHSFSAPIEFKARMLRDLDIIKSTFETRYAPAEWKKRNHDWELDREIQAAKAKVASGEVKSIKTYQQMLRTLLMSTRDYHVGIGFYSTEESNLPFRIRGAEGKYFITFIDRGRLPERSFPFKIGDELVSFAGRSIQDVIEAIKIEETSNANTPTNQALAERMLTTRQGSLGMTVPKGPVILSIRSAKSQALSRYQIMWDYTPERIQDLMTLLPAASPDRPYFTSLEDHPIFNRKLMSPLFERDIEQAGHQAHDPNDIGAREGFIPGLGPKIWESDPTSPFHAYIFTSPAGREIGYVRIPHYIGGKEEVEQFGAIISHLEKRTEALVVDQVNNPGGMVFYCYALASMLTDQPLFTPRHRMTVTQEDVFVALQTLSNLTQIKSDDDARAILGDSVCGYPVDYQTALFMINFLRFLVDEWNVGHTLTNPYYLFGVDYINPNPYTHYTKPIIVLINELDFSGGDFFPAILQDNQRVTLFGTRTAGAGGYVDGCSHPNIFGVAGMNYTASIAERIDNSPIENLGVVPDVSYELTADDLQNNYRGYVNGVLNTVESVLKSR